jgi:hypothetical protein
MCGTQLNSSSKFINVTPSNTVPLTYQGKKIACKGISFKTAGVLAIKDDENTTVEIPSGSLVAGTIHPISTSYILATNTTAASIVAYF